MSLKLAKHPRVEPSPLQRLVLQMAYENGKKNSKPAAAVPRLAAEPAAPARARAANQPRPPAAGRRPAEKTSGDSRAPRRRAAASDPLKNGGRNWLTIRLPFRVRSDPIRYDILL